jgi:U6 snRNA-associated Sm-like protein LSm2
MLFFSFFKTLVGQEVSVELKNGVIIRGVLVSVDQYLNVKLNTVNVADGVQYPQLAALKNCFVRGSVIR